MCIFLTCDKIFLGIIQFPKTTRTELSICVFLYVNFDNLHWFTYFNRLKIMKIVHGKKNFDFHILTDGLAVSVQFSKPKPKKPINLTELMEEQQQKYAEFGRRYLNDKYSTIIRLDPGYKQYIAGATNFELREETEVNFVSQILQHDSSEYSWSKR